MNMCRLAVIFLVIWSVSLAALPPGVQAGPYLIDGENLGIESSGYRFKINIQTNKKCYQQGEYLVAMIGADRDCHILVYYTNEKGNCLIVYPNKYESKDRITAQEVFYIGDDHESFALMVDKDQVRDYLQVVATEKPISTASLAGIKDPEEFVARLRLILEEMVEDAAREGKRSGPRPILAVGTTDYLCNYPSYFPPGEKKQEEPPQIRRESQPRIDIRQIDIPDKTDRIVGPDAPPSGTAAMKGKVYTVSLDRARIVGTVIYAQGVKSILVNGEKPSIKSIGSSKGLVLDDKGIVIEESKDEPYRVLDFEYIITGLQKTPKEVTITAEGLDGAKARQLIRVMRDPGGRP